MAFLCPVRIRRNKKKGDSTLPPNFFSGSSSSPVVSPSPPGRITGSSSIETLVRVGLEKEAGPSARMTVLHDFTPCVDDELGVMKGDIVSLLYREHDWAYVIDSKTPPNEGFIPFTYITPLKETETDEDDTEEEIEYPPPVYFHKSPSEFPYINLFDFKGVNENDLTLERGAIVTLLNDEDPDWSWVIKSNGEEGFVPSSFIYCLRPGQIPGSSEQPSTSAAAGMNQPQQLQQKGPERVTEASGGKTHVELVMLYDYKAQTSDDLTVKRGEWVHVNLSDQSTPDWLWAYAPKQKRYGFIPLGWAHPPAMTSL